MNSDRREVSWDDLLGTARRLGTTGAGNASAPEDFVKRVRQLRAGLWEFARLLLWRRSAVVFALAAAALYVGCYFVLREPSGPAIPRPVVPNLAPP